MRYLHFIIFVCVLILSSIAHADKWYLDPEVKDSEYVFSEIKIVLHYDSTQNHYFPKYTTRIFNKDKLLAEHEGVGFEKVYSSPDVDYFLGVSNSGLIKDAFIIFDRYGHVLKKQSQSPPVKYCEKSVTLISIWFNKENPDPKFVVENSALKDITIRACDGTRISLVSENH